MRRLHRRNGQRKRRSWKDDCRRAIPTMQEWLRSLRQQRLLSITIKCLPWPEKPSKINAVRYTAGRKMNSHYNSERAVYKQWFVAVLFAWREKNMEESKKVNTEHFKKKIGNTTYRVRVHFPQNTKRTFTDSVNTLIMNECTSKKK